ncbi:hypothetical protein J7643_19270 [bacterium]|nr:hypothetical protein [bacterium]
MKWSTYNTFARRLVDDLSKETLPALLVATAIEATEAAEGCLRAPGMRVPMLAMDRTGRTCDSFAPEEAPAGPASLGAHQDADGRWVQIFPLRGFSGVVGVLALRRQEPFSPEQVQAAELLVAMAAMACDYRRSQERHERQLDAALELYDVYEQTQHQLMAEEKKVEVALGLYDLFEQTQQQLKAEEQKLEAALGLYDLYEEAQKKLKAEEEKVQVALGLYDLYEETQNQLTAEQAKLEAALGLYDLYEEAQNRLLEHEKGKQDA